MNSIESDPNFLFRDAPDVAGPAAVDERAGGERVSERAEPAKLPQRGP